MSDEVAINLIERAVEYGKSDNADLTPYEFAACVVSGAVRAWFEIVMAIDKTKDRASDLNKLRGLVQTICTASVEDAIYNITNQKKGA